MPTADERFPVWLRYLRSPAWSRVPSIARSRHLRGVVMPTADLRDLAARLGLLQSCVTSHGQIPDYVFGACDRCDDTGQRMPTEAEVRVAIRAAGWPVVYVKAQETFVQVEVCRPSQERQASAVGDEASPDDLVLLALLRALEAARG